MILKRKYDAFVTDRAYENQPHGRMGPIGRMVDGFVLRFPCTKPSVNDLLWW